MRDFSQKVYDTNGATPKQNSINQMNERIAAQNKLAQSGGAAGDSVEVPQTVNARQQVSPNNPNTNNARMMNAQLTMDRNAQAQANTGQKIGGRRTRRTRTNTRTRRNRKRTNKKSRKY